MYDIRWLSHGFVALLRVESTQEPNLKRELETL